MRVVISDPDVARKVASAIARVLDVPPPPPVPSIVIHARSSASKTAGKIAIVPVTSKNARHLIAIADLARDHGALGVQLVWDGQHECLERHIFAVLEHARGTPKAAPVVLARTPALVPALLSIVAFRRKTASC
jgi:hypothetical protein